MRERPILFSGSMVRAILDGRKTQTRRAVKPQPGESFARNFVTDERLSYGWSWRRSGAHGYVHCPSTQMMEFCPYGAPGDRLWVRETWMETCDPHTLQGTGQYLYRATYEGEAAPILCDGDGFTVWRKDGYAASPWRPSIHMPRAASRLTLEVVSVCVERLQEISEADAVAEGCGLTGPVWNPHRDGLHMIENADPRGSYQVLWDEINGPGAWDANPWVWVVEFRRVET